MSRFLPLVAIMLLAPVTVFALDPPPKVWEEVYYEAWDGAFFRDMELTASGNLFMTGNAYDWTNPYMDFYTAFLLDQDGNVLWEVIQPWYGVGAYDGEVLPDDSFIITGVSVEEPDSTYSLFIMKISQSGAIEWTRVYDHPATKEEGYGIACLPDGGYAVCGRVNGTGNIEGQAWILRTDANGDTLWTDVWGEAPANWGKSVLFSNEMICVLTFGYDDTLTTLGTHLLFYDLDGTYIHGTEDGLLTSEHPAAFVDASDGGYTLVTELNPEIVHTDPMGEILWWQDIEPPPDFHEGHGVRTTMDSGYLFCGWCGVWSWPDSLGVSAPIVQADTGSTMDGWLIRLDSEGNTLWGRQNEMGTDNVFYSALQLPQGGYFAAGTHTGGAYLVRYAPETGIEEGPPSPLSTLSASPNPFSSAVEISFSLASSSEIQLSVYDLSGRRIEDLWVGSSPAGEHDLTWVPGSSIPAGCYLVVLDTPGERQVRRVVRL